MLMAVSSSAPRGLRVQGMPLSRWLTTTPGRLRLASIGLVIGLVVTAISAATATSARQDAAEAASDHTAPALVSAESLYSELADADATAAVIYLEAGIEPPELRRRYLDDLDSANRRLAEVADAADISATAREAVQTTMVELTAYAASVEAARSNSRQNHPVGATYLGDASQLMRDEILPAATAIYIDASRSLDDNYESAMSPVRLALPIALGLLLLVVLTATQVYLHRRTRRLLNVPLLAVSGLVVVVLIGLVAQFDSSRGALIAAREDGSDTVQLLSSARILTLRASSDESQALVERGTGDRFYDDFDVITPRVDELLAAAEEGAVPGEQQRIRELQEGFAEFVNAHGPGEGTVRNSDQDGAYQNAVTTSTNEQTKRVSDLDDSYAAAIGDATESMHDDLDRAASGFDLLAIGVPLLLAVAVALALAGLGRRIREFR
jgi:hypothetical protein